MKAFLYAIFAMYLMCERIIDDEAEMIHLRKKR